jgi:hypothetical protein
MLLLVDEAHTLPLRLLDEMRMLTNLARKGRPQVRLVLAGGSALEEKLANPKLDSFSQRLVARCYLESFSRAETQDYICARINAVGGPCAMIFPEATCQSVHRATDGVPRLINQVCDHALLLAHAAGQRQLQPAHVEAAWADLQQLPTPWNGETRTETAGAGVVEFGGLDDSPDETAAPMSAEPTTADESHASGSSCWPAALPPLEPDFAEAGPGDSAIVEPAEQLQEIEELLSAADGDFQPAGLQPADRTTPEVELSFDEPDHPFAEQFQEEEVVADRYAVAGGPPAAAMEAVRPHSAEWVVSSPPQMTSASAFAAQQDAEPETVLLCGPQSVAEPEAGDADILILEDQCDAEIELPPRRPAVAVRGHQYGRLFAKLRRA